LPYRTLRKRNSIGDERILRLIRKWLKARVLEAGIVTEGEAGTPQGATVSPLLANAYLHYVFDPWVSSTPGRSSGADATPPAK